jgi:hypothetical protein
MSRERLEAYSLTADTDSTDALARYLFNGQLCAAFQPVLHAFEITFRNALFDASQAVVATTGRKQGSVNCWLDVDPPLLDARAHRAVEDAKRRLGGLRFHTPGRLISKLNFGFWTNLLDRPYEQGKKGGPNLWPRLIPVVFPNIPRRYASRQAIADKIKSIRDFRNRIAHHDPIWDRPLLIHHSEILEVLGWVNAPMQKAAQAYGNPIIVLNAGHDPFRHAAERLLGI